MDLYWCKRNIGLHNLNVLLTHTEGIKGFGTNDSNNWDFIHRYCQQKKIKQMQELIQLRYQSLWSWHITVLLIFYPILLVMINATSKRSDSVASLVWWWTVMLIFLLWMRHDFYFFFVGYLQVLAVTKKEQSHLISPHQHSQIVPSYQSHTPWLDGAARLVGLHFIWDNSFITRHACTVLESLGRKTQIQHSIAN